MTARAIRFNNRTTANGFRDNTVLGSEPEIRSGLCVALVPGTTQCPPLRIWDGWAGG